MYPEDIYSETECRYLQSIMKKKLQSVTAAEELQGIYEKAKRTLKHQMERLLLGKTWQTICESYQEEVSNNQKETINNCIKLLLRCKKMYEAE